MLSNHTFETNFEAGKGVPILQLEREAFLQFKPDWSVWPFKRKHPSNRFLYSSLHLLYFSFEFNYLKYWLSSVCSVNEYSWVIRWARKNYVFLFTFYYFELAGLGLVGNPDSVKHWLDWLAGRALLKLFLQYFRPDLIMGRTCSTFVWWDQKSSTIPRENHQINYYKQHPNHPQSLGTLNTGLLQE